MSHFEDCSWKEMKGCNCSQRYRVEQVLLDEEAKVRVWGWSSDPKGGRLALAAQKHPETRMVRVVDRQTGTVEHMLDRRTNGG